MENNRNNAAIRRTLDMLIAILERETVLHEEMLAAAEIKQQVIIQGDLPGLEEIISREKELIAGIEEEEVKRKTVMPMLQKNLGMENEAQKLSDIVNLLVEPEKALLSGVREKLRQTLTACRIKTRQNAELLKASLAHVDAFLRTVSEAVSKDANYNKSGKRGGNSPALLDRSA